MGNENVVVDESLTTKLLDLAERAVSPTAKKLTNRNRIQGVYENPITYFGGL